MATNVTMASTASLDQAGHGTETPLGLLIGS